jgi:threonine synthase
MHFISTAGEAPEASLREALSRGLAPDGGLYMPSRIPEFSPSELVSLSKSTWPETASAVLGPLLEGSLDPETLANLTASALDFPLPLNQIRDRIHVLELFRGPTLAFKDVGARFMARLLVHQDDGDGVPLTVLTATSGDTGGAVAQAFFGLPGVRVVVLFPDGKVTPRQESQFSTLGGNVVAVAVQGDFDDCQRLAKEAFLTRTALPDHTRLTSANSINVGRFLPQTTYFFKIWAAFQARTQNRTNILFSVPSGNFGNLAAGLLGKAMGLPDVSFLAATNENDVVPSYLESGIYGPRPSTPTLSTAMDVGDPSNLQRILHLYEGDLDSLRSDLVGRKVSDRETQDCIRRVFQETGYILDPHSAVGYAALERELEARPDATGVLLATAHPAKFAEIVEPILRQTLPIPPELSRCMEGKRQIIRMEPRMEALRELLSEDQTHQVTI